MAKSYQGQNKIYYVYFGSNATSSYSGTLEMCQKYMSNKSDSYSLDHRSFRSEYK